MRYHFKIHKEKGGGYWAESLETGLNAHTQADTLAELYVNMREVLDLCLDEPENSTYLPPMPDSSLMGKNIVEVSPNPNIAFASMVRRYRLLKHWSQKRAMVEMGIKHLSQYQKLERGKTANPELATIAKLKKVFPALSLDDVLA